MIVINSVLLISRIIKKNKKLATVFADHVPRLETVKALAKNIANPSMVVSNRDGIEQKYFEMCYQGAIEEVLRRYDRLPRKIKKMLEGGGSRRSDRDKKDILEAIEITDCTEFHLQGVMETAVMKVIVTLEDDYHWRVLPSRVRMLTYSNNRSGGSGFRRIVGRSAARGW